MTPPFIVAAIVISFLAGRASMAREIAEHDHAFNAHVRRIAFRFARAAYPKKKPSQKVIP